MDGYGGDIRDYSKLQDLKPFGANPTGDNLFDASQYAFFGNDAVEEVELGGLEDEEEDIAPVGFEEEEFQLGREENWVVFSESLDIWAIDKSCGQWFKKFSAVERPLLVAWSRPVQHYNWSLKPLQLLSSGEILMVANNWNLVRYDMKTNCFTSIRLHMKRPNFNVVTFVPSFMSLKDTLYNGQLI